MRGYHPLSPLGCSKPFFWYLKMMKLAVLDSFEDRFLSSVLIELGQNQPLFFLVFFFPTSSYLSSGLWETMSLEHRVVSWFGYFELVPGLIDDGILKCLGYWVLETPRMIVACQQPPSWRDVPKKYLAPLCHSILDDGSPDVHSRISHNLFTSVSDFGIHSMSSSRASIPFSSLGIRGKLLVVSMSPTVPQFRQVPPAVS